MRHLLQYTHGQYGEIAGQTSPPERQTSAMWPHPKETVEAYRYRVEYSMRAWALDHCVAWEMSTRDRQFVRVYDSHNAYEQVHWRPQYLVVLHGHNPEGEGGDDLNDTLIYTSGYQNLLELKIKYSALLLPKVLQELKALNATVRLYNAIPSPAKPARKRR